MKEAYFYSKQKNNAVKCLLCPHECQINEGNLGICGVRINKNGTLFTKNYNYISSFCIDPIEKKPLKGYRPGTSILSIGTMGCNFKCDFCQNYSISQMEPDLKMVTVDDLLKLSDSYNDSIGIAFTYNEPTIWYEYIYESAKKNKKDTILVTNGFINKEPLINLLPYIDAMNIDIKSINPKFYKKYCFGKLESVQQSIKIAYEKTHIELTFLAIPNLNDTTQEITKLSKWIADIDSKIPLHIIPFRPMYKMKNIPYQTYEKIHELKDTASKKLDFIY